MGCTGGQTVYIVLLVGSKQQSAEPSKWVALFISLQLLRPHCNSPLHSELLSQSPSFSSQGFSILQHDHVNSSPDPVQSHLLSLTITK